MSSCRIFCTNVVNDKETNDTLKDIRTFVDVRSHGKDCYAVEITSRYKVYTHYRSSSDSVDGSFVAITVLVPHSLMITNIREVLDEMVTRCFSEYINPLNGTPLPGKSGEVTPLLALLGDIARIEPDSRMLRYVPPVQINIPVVMKYDDLATVDGYFENPYRKELIDGRWMIFSHSDFVDYRAPEILTKVSESVPMNRLIPMADDSVEIVSLRVNGDDFTGHIDGVGLRSDDRVVVTLRRRFFHDWTGSGTVDELVKSGFLSRQGKDYRMVLPRMKPVRYYLKVQVNGKNCDTNTVAPLLRISNKTEGVVSPVQLEGVWVFPIDGPKVTAEYIVGLYPNQYSNEKFPIGKCRPFDMIEAQSPLEVTAVGLTPRIRLPEGANPEIEAEIYTANMTLETRVIEGEQLIVPPTVKMSLRAHDFNVSLVDGVYVFKPAFESITISLPQIFNRLVADCKLAVRYEGKDYEIKNYVARLPYGASGKPLALSCRSKDRELLVPMLRLADGAFTVTGTLVVNCLPVAVQVKIAGNLKKVVPGVIAAESVADVVFANQLDSEQYSLNHEDYTGLRIYAIRPIDAAADTFARDAATDSVSPDDVTVRFVNCGKYYIDGKKIEDGKAYTVNKGDEVEVTTRKVDDVVANFKAGGNSRTSGEFEVKNDGKGRYTVTYRPSTLSRMVEALFSKTGLIISSLLLVAILILLAWLLIFNAETPRYYYINLKTAEPDKVASIVPLDSLDRLMKSSGATICFTRTKPVNPEVGSERFVVNYVDEGVDTLTIGDVVRGDEYSDLQTFLQSESPKEATRNINLPATPAARMYKALSVNVNEDSIARFHALYPASRYADSLAVALEKMNEIKAQEAAAAEAEKAAYDAKLNSYKALITKLDRMDCSMTDVDAIEKYQKEHAGEDIAAEFPKYSAKVKAYRTFFDPKDSPCKYRKSFTTQQQEAVKYYDTYWHLNNKNDPKRNFNYAAGELKKMGVK